MFDCIKTAFMTIAEQLKNQRESEGVTQKKLSENTNISVDTINKIETGRNTNPTIYVLQTLGKALNFKFEL